MTVKDVLQEVELIRELALDDEAAHSAEDSLWEKVLESIANGRQDRVEAQEVAAAALKTRSINFARWCA